MNKRLLNRLNEERKYIILLINILTSFSYPMWAYLYFIHNAPWASYTLVISSIISISIYFTSNKRTELSANLIVFTFIFSAIITGSLIIGYGSPGFLFLALAPYACFILLKGKYQKFGIALSIVSLVFFSFQIFSYQAPYQVSYEVYLLFRQLSISSVVILSGIVTYIITNTRNALDKKYNDIQLNQYVSNKQVSEGIIGSQIAHEINNPLTILSGHYQAMRKKLNENEVDPDFEKIQGEIEKLKNTIGVVRAITYKEDIMQKEWHETDNILDFVLGFFRKKFKENRIIYSVVYKDPIPEKVFLDKIVFTKIMIIAFQNAFEAMKKHDEKVFEITISAQKDKLIIDLKNTGDSIPLELEKFIFNSFWTTKGKYHAGLGLSQINEYCKLINAKYDLIENQPVIFRLEIPL